MVSIVAPLEAIGAGESVSGMLVGSFVDGVPQLTAPTGLQIVWPACGPNACTSEVILTTAEITVFGGIAFDFSEQLTDISVSLATIPTQVPIPWFALGILVTCSIFLLGLRNRTNNRDN